LLCACPEHDKSIICKCWNSVHFFYRQRDRAMDQNQIKAVICLLAAACLLPAEADARRGGGRLRPSYCNTTSFPAWLTTLKGQPVLEASFLHLTTLARSDGQANIYCSERMWTQLAKSPLSVQVMQQGRLGSMSYNPKSRRMMYTAASGRTGTDYAALRICGEMRGESGCFTYRMTFKLE
jgi:hypothetical protein